MGAAAVAFTSGALTVPREDIVPAGGRGTRDGFLDVVTFQRDLEGQSDLDGQRGGRGHSGKRLSSKEEVPK